ncbi:MAG: CBS domain-containing protein [Zoogloea sp.]|nr:CBS domain-containing protein [Zoogloea sp.]
MPNRKLRDIVRTQQIFTASPDTSVREATRRMAAASIGSMLVVDDSGRLTGIFTERDALIRVLAAGIDPDSTPLAAVMTAGPQVARAEQTLSVALHMMYEGGYRHVPVMENGRPIGVVSARNALGLELVQFEKELQQRDEIAEIL